MPNQDQLPGALANLARRNAVELSDSRFRGDMQVLFATLEKIADQKIVTPGRATPARPLGLGAPPLLQGGEYPPIAPQLEADTRYQRDQPFSFAIPGGWIERVPDQLTALSKSVGIKALAGITTQGIEPHPTDIAVCGGFLASGPDFLSEPANTISERERATGLAIGAGPYRIGMGGVPAVLFYLRGTAPGQLYGRDGHVAVVSGEAWTVRGNRVYSVVMSGPYDRYTTNLPAFYTVLGTWVWT